MMKVSLFAFTITVQKRRETAAEAIRKERMKEVQDLLIDCRVNDRIYK